MIKFFISLLTRLILLIIILAAGWTGYNYFFVETATAPPLPDLPGYKVVEAQDLTGYLKTLGEEAAQLTQQAELAEATAGVDEIIRCYREVGAVRARIYSHEQTPLVAGAVVIADRNAMLNPINLFNCIAPKAQGGVGIQSVRVEPCTANYTLTRDAAKLPPNEFYIRYAGTTPEICQAFCAQLEGCTAH